MSDKLTKEEWDAVNHVRRYFMGDSRKDRELAASLYAIDHMLSARKPDGPDTGDIDPTGLLVRVERLETEVRNHFEEIATLKAATIKDKRKLVLS